MEGERPKEEKAREQSPDLTVSKYKLPVHVQGERGNDFKRAQCH